ncbi:MAG TPA: lipoyl(octanoyl) transferase LipB [Phycisphaerales bacterium]|nr:lipoyl(octanoyl) transferase LipB [Phycisphaerales bacterium]
MQVQDLGTMRYREAWAVQEKVHEDVRAGAEETLILVEHPPVITLGRRGEFEGAKHLVASQHYLDQLGVELVQSDRGGDITFHGPGQIVAYPIVRLIDHHLSVGAYVHTLEEIVIATLKELGVEAQKDASGIGVWVKEKDEGLRRAQWSRERMKGETQSVTRASPPVLGAPEDRSIPASSQPSTGETPVSRDAVSPPPLAKICALGVRVRRGVSLHGIALNVETDLRYFDLIVPCGLTGKRATSLRKIMGDATPSIEAVKRALVQHFMRSFASNV